MPIRVDRMQNTRMDSEVDTLVRAARELLRWDQKQLAQKAAVGLATVRRFETGQRVGEEIVKAITEALEAAGVCFLGPGLPTADIKAGVALTTSGQPLARPDKRIYRKRAGENVRSTPIDTKS